MSRILLFSMVVVYCITMPAKGSGADRFIVSGTNDLVITDSVTGLMWQKSYYVQKPEETWKDALKYCESLDYGGHKDWRLPNIKELTSLVNYSKGNLNTASDFPDMPSYWFWSSSSLVHTTAHAWGVDFGHGYVVSYDKAERSMSVVCVGLDLIN